MTENTDTFRTEAVRFFSEHGYVRVLLFARLATDTGWIVRCEGLPDMVVGDPAFLAEAVDSREFIDNAARAALAFWADDGRLGWDVDGPRRRP